MSRDAQYSFRKPAAKVSPAPVVSATRAHRGTRDAPLAPEGDASLRAQGHDQNLPVAPGEPLQFVDEIPVARAQAEEAQVKPIAVSVAHEDLLARRVAVDVLDGGRAFELPRRASRPRPATARRTWALRGRCPGR
jgi:hypothetical protein